MGNRPSRWYAPLGFWLRTIAIMVATVWFEWQWATTGWWVWGALVGWMHAFIGLAVQHDASHGALSKSPAVNAFFSYGADWIGNSRWLWMQQHVIGHHPHTNIEGHDPDAHSAEPVLLFHSYDKADSPRRGFHAWQWLYMFLVLPWYGPSLVADYKQLAHMRHGDEVPPNPWTRTQRPLAVATRLWYIGRICLAPIVLGGASIASGLLLVPLVAGGILTFVFVVSHNFEGSDRFPTMTKGDSVDWYKLQVRARVLLQCATAGRCKRGGLYVTRVSCAQVETSCTYGGWWAMFWSGGLNLQIEHHLFPRLSSWYASMLLPTPRIALLLYAHPRTGTTRKSHRWYRKSARSTA